MRLPTEDGAEVGGATPLAMRVVVTRVASQLAFRTPMATNDRNQRRDDSIEPTEYAADRRPADAIDVEETTISPSVPFGIPADIRPRYVPDYLTAHGETAGIGDLAIATRENDTTAELLTTEMTTRVRSNLYHTELPKPADYGFVEYDLEAETVTHGPDRGTDPVSGTREAIGTERANVSPPSTARRTTRRRHESRFERAPRNRFD